MPTLRRKPAPFGHHGLFLVPNAKKNNPPASNFVYRIVAVGAALFLAITVC